MGADVLAWDALSPPLIHLSARGANYRMLVRRDRSRPLRCRPSRPGRDALAGEAATRAVALAKQAAVGAIALPFASLTRLHALLRQDTLFAPVERGSRSLSVAGREVAIEQPAPRTPLWAVDLALGHLLASCGNLAARRPRRRHRGSVAAPFEAPSRGNGGRPDAASERHTARRAGNRGTEARGHHARASWAFTIKFAGAGALDSARGVRAARGSTRWQRPSGSAGAAPTRSERLS